MFFVINPDNNNPMNPKLPTIKRNIALKAITRFIAVVAACLAATSLSAFAATGTWTGSDSGTWNTTSTNWSGVSGTPWDATNGPNNDATTALNINVSGTVYTHGLTFTASKSVSGGVITLAGTNPFIGTGSGLFDNIVSDLAGTSGLTVNGKGQIILQSNAKSITGGLSVNAGANLRLDLSTATTGIVASSNALTLGGGTLEVQGKSTGSSSQTLGNLTLNAGASTISLNPNGGTGTTLTLGNAWTKNAGGTLFIDLSNASAGTRTLTSNPTLSNGIIGGYTIVKDSGGTGFATVSGGNVVRYTGATTLNGNLGTDTISTENYQITGASNFNGAAATQTVNSLEIAGGSLGSFSTKALVINSGGLIFNSSHVLGWNTGITSVTSGTGELDVYMTAGSTIQAKITDNGGTSVSLAKSGVGTLTLGGLNGSHTYSGNTIVNQGTLQGLQYIPNGAGKGNLVINGSGLADINNSDVTINGLANTAANGGTIANYGGTMKTLTLGNANATASFNGVVGAAGANSLNINKIGTGTQTFAGNNTYTGTTSVSAGTLLVAAGGSIGAGSAVTVSSGAAIGGDGTINGNLTLNSGAKFVFDLNNTALTVGGTFALSSTFGVDDLVTSSLGAIDWSTVGLGTYRLIGTSFVFNAGNIENFGVANAFVSGGKQMYFANGSLDLVVVPEPSTWALLAFSLTTVMVLRRRRNS